jgi:hypothetical protein
MPDRSVTALLQTDRLTVVKRPDQEVKLQKRAQRYTGRGMWHKKTGDGLRTPKFGAVAMRFKLCYYNLC